MNWINVAPFWEELGNLADARDRQKRGFASTRQWNDESHFVGLLAEQIYALHKGLQIDKRLLINGDRGIDFPGVDVKGCRYWRDPWLKHPVGKKLTVGTYVLVALDLDLRRGYLAGYATSKELLCAPVVNWGHGRQYSLCAKSLHLFEAEEQKEIKDWSAPDPRWIDGPGARARPFWE